MKTRKILYAMLTILFVTVLSLACSKSSTNSTPTTSTISIKNTGYSNASLQVVKGSTVMWRNDDAVAHTVTADNGSFDSGDIMAGATYSFSFASTGTFTYHDKHNAMATGTIVVVNATSGGGGY
jgi:plastocyanin